ncbi:hypothetical protein B9479_007059 [Cryptococcus floricola]|uniref:Uncharacterized protein n=1 Tax=Cryptococcus floricola TaxID=2591691 RepID=A0A5D3AQJ2_9TREE|nr:hypothetical protein B9479_007059 [Cryptococcus floricola]
MEDGERQAAAERKGAAEGERADPGVSLPEGKAERKDLHYEKQDPNAIIFFRTDIETIFDSLMVIRPINPASGSDNGPISLFVHMRDLQTTHKAAGLCSRGELRHPSRLVGKRTRFGFCTSRPGDDSSQSFSNSQLDNASIRLEDEGGISPSGEAWALRTWIDREVQGGPVEDWFPAILNNAIKNADRYYQKKKHLVTNSRSLFIINIDPLPN